MVYLPTFAIKINQLKLNMPRMDHSLLWNGSIDQSSVMRTHWVLTHRHVCMHAYMHTKKSAKGHRACYSHTCTYSIRSACIAKIMKQPSLSTNVRSSLRTCLHTSTYAYIYSIHPLSLTLTFECSNHSEMPGDQGKTKRPKGGGFFGAIAALCWGKMGEIGW